MVRFADHFKSADKYIVSLPMWNFGIPYKLKHDNCFPARLHAREPMNGSRQRVALQSQ